MRLVVVAAAVVVAVVAWAFAAIVWVLRVDDEYIAEQNATIAYLRRARGEQEAVLQRYRRWLISGEHPGDDPAEPGAAG